MNIYTVQTRLMAAIAAAIPAITVLDNVLPPLPSSFPFIAVDPVSGSPMNYAGGTQGLQSFTFEIYTVVALSAHGNLLAPTRAALASLTDTILAIPRLYASSVHYGEDVIGTTRVSISHIKCTYPI